MRAGVNRASLQEFMLLVAPIPDESISTLTALVGKARNQIGPFYLTFSR